MARVCSVNGCGRKHAAHGLCLMHYKRVQRHGSAEYKWGGKAVGRSCTHCARPVVAREMCMRHYQMWRNHGDPLFSDSKKAGGMPPGTHKRRGYLMTASAPAITANPAGPTVEKTHRHWEKTSAQPEGLRGGGRKREWNHRKVAGAKPGQIVHHIDGNRMNNEIDNLHVFEDAKAHGDAHRSLEKIAFQLLRNGLVRFDRETGAYLLLECAPPAIPCS